MSCSPSECLLAVQDTHATSDTEASEHEGHGSGIAHSRHHTLKLLVAGVLTLTVIGFKCRGSIQRESTSSWNVAVSAPPSVAMLKLSLFPTSGTLGLQLTTVTTTTLTRTTPSTTADLLPFPMDALTEAEAPVQAVGTSKESVLGGDAQRLGHVPSTVPASDAPEALGTPAPELPHEAQTSHPPTTHPHVSKQSARSGIDLVRSPPVASPETRVFGGHQCDAVQQSQPPPTVPHQCRMPVSQYPSDAKVRRQCTTIKLWEKAAHKHKARGSCRIDPKTKRMTCTRDKTCTGGERKRVNYATVTRNITYNCAAGCTGALLIDCCTSCASYQQNPGKLEVDSIECLGCAEDKLSQAANGVDCKLVDGQFHCSEMSSCATGVLEKSCQITDFVCDVYNCDSCADEQLKARCCSDCLQKMCYGTVDRMHCQGCEVVSPAPVQPASTPSPSPLWFR